MAQPQRLLEVTINSAHDLPPMAQMLRTFVVVWVNPENKLSTRVDHQGHTNPTWNDKLLFRVDDDFLKSESSSVMMVIYNLAWLRDLPMGTTNLMIGQILKSLTHKNQAMRNITLRIRRPTGHLQGTLNVSVNLVGHPLPTSTPQRHHLPSASKTRLRDFFQPKKETLLEKFDHLILENKIGVEKKIREPKKETLSKVFDPLELQNNVGVENKIRQPKKETLSEMFENLELENKLAMKKNKINKRKIPNSTISGTNSMKDSSATDISSISDSTMWVQKSLTGTKSKTVSSNDSFSPQMKHLTPPEAASDIKKGYYSPSPGSSACNDVFENWTDVASTEGKTWISKDSRWGKDDHIGVKPMPMPIPMPKMKQRKKSSAEKGLLSCFGNVAGFQCNIFCWSGKKKRKSKYETKGPTLISSDQTLHRFEF